MRPIVPWVQTDPAVDAYLATLSEAHRALLGTVREELHDLVPDGVEGISYGMPVVRVEGEVLLYFAGWAKHCALYPVPPEFKAAHAAELGAFGGSKDSVHFTPARPLPPGILAEFVRYRRQPAG